MLIFGECDSCGAENRVLHHGFTGCGLEAYACAECRGGDPDEDEDDIRDEIDAIESEPLRHGGGLHRDLLLANLKAELVRITTDTTRD